MREAGNLKRETNLASKLRGVINWRAFYGEACHTDRKMIAREETAFTRCASDPTDFCLLPVCETDTQVSKTIAADGSGAEALHRGSRREGARVPSYLTVAPQTGAKLSQRTEKVCGT